MSTGVGLLGRLTEVAIATKAERIKLVLLDVDGVLTDGRVIIHGDGQESKTFGIRDGIALVWAQRAGLKVGFLSARQSATTVRRASQLGVTLVRQGVTSKAMAYQQIVETERLSDAEVAYMGDDIVDLAVLARAGLSAAPADAVVEVRARVDWVSARPAGAGAVRELIELILRAQKRWDDIVRGYLHESAGPGPVDPEAAPEQAGASAGSRRRRSRRASHKP